MTCSTKEQSKKRRWGVKNNPNCQTSFMDVPLKIPSNLRLQLLIYLSSLSFLCHSDSGKIGLSGFVRQQRSVYSASVHLDNNLQKKCIFNPLLLFTTNPLLPCLLAVLFRPQHKNGWPDRTFVQSDPTKFKSYRYISLGNHDYHNPFTFTTN